MPATNPNNPGVAFAAIAGTPDQVESAQCEHYPTVFQLDKAGRLWVMWNAQDPASVWELFKPLPNP